MIKLTKKELKTPDQIWQTSRSVLTWMTEQMTVILIVAGLLFVAIIGGVYSYQTRQKTEGKAQAHYSTAKSALEQLKLPAPDAKAVKDHVTTESDIQKELDLLASEFKSSFANRLADQIRGELAAQKKLWPQAISFYQEYEKALPKSERDLALYPLADIYEQSGDLTKALSTYDEILSRKDSLFSSLSMLGKARVLRGLHRNAEAKQVYESFLEKHPDSPDVANVRGLLALSLEDQKK